MKKYVFVLALAFLATQFLSCSSSDDDQAMQSQSYSNSNKNAVQLISPDEECTRSLTSDQIPSSGNVEPKEGQTFYMDYAWIEPTVIEVPSEGKVTFSTHHYGDYKTVRRVIPDGAPWIKGMFSQDYLETNRYKGNNWGQFYIFIPPNETNKARQDTIKFLFAVNKDVPNEKRFCVPVVIKQKAGPFSTANLKNHILGKWHHHIIGTNALTGQPYTESNYDVVFNADGSYREDQHEVGINRDYKFEGWEEGTYEITKVEIDDQNCLRVYLKQSYKYGPTTATAGYSSGSRETYFVVYPHFMMWATGRSRYYDRVVE